MPSCPRSRLARRKFGFGSMAVHQTRLVCDSRSRIDGCGVGGDKVSPSQKAGRCHLDRGDTRLASQLDSLASVVECGLIVEGGDVLVYTLLVPRLERRRHSKCIARPKRGNVTGKGRRQGVRGADRVERRWDWSTPGTATAVPWMRLILHTRAAAHPLPGDFGSC